MINKAENYPKNRNPRGKSACKTAKKAPKSENLRLQFTKKKNREIYPRRSVKRPKKAKIKDKITQKSEIPGKICIQNISQNPQKAKIQGYNSPKKKTGKSTQRRSVKRPKKAKIKTKSPKKVKFQCKNG